RAARRRRRLRLYRTIGGRGDHGTKLPRCDSRTSENGVIHIPFARSIAVHVISFQLDPTYLV
ncbi:MAG: hypothetical protein ABII76_13815, partial [Pseudomonadota bacterium]